MTSALEGGFQFNEMLPEFALRVEARRVFDEIANLAPYGSSFDAWIGRVGDSFQVEIQIRSAAGRFFATSLSPGWRTGLSEIEHEMLRKFESWRTERFSEAEAEEERQLAA